MNEDLVQLDDDEDIPLPPEPQLISMASFGQLSFFFYFCHFSKSVSKDISYIPYLSSWRLVAEQRVGWPPPAIPVSKLRNSDNCHHHPHAHHPYPLGLTYFHNLYLI